MNRVLVFRKRLSDFHSIENAFDTLLPYLKIGKVELPHASMGILKRLKNILFLLRLKADLIHISGHDHYLLWYPFKKAILTIHDLESLKRKRGIKKWLFQKLWFEIPIRNANRVTTISEFSKQELRELFPKQNDIRVIHNTLSLPLKYSSIEFNEEKPRILHIVTKKNKNLNRLIQALRGINCHLTILGKVESALESILLDSGIDFTLKSGLTRDQMQNLYQECDMLAFVSTYEGFGLPILEAQAVGRVVLTSDLSSMPEVAGEGGLYVDPFSVESIRNGIQKLINNRELREELIKKGLKNIERFKAELITKKYMALYEELESE